VDELVEGMLFISENSHDTINLYNLGPEDTGCSVADIACAAAKRVSPRANIVFGTEGRGWIGDVPRFRYCVDKAAKLGWRAKLSSFEAVHRSIDEVALQEGIPGTTA
jgi:UDP-glucose 4-epimerase